MSNDHLLKQIYNVTANVSYNINNAMNYVCDFLGLSLSEFNFENVQDENYFVNRVMTSLTDLYNDEWYTCINDDDNDTKNKLKFYRKFKKVSEGEPYLKFVSNPILRAHLTKLRISAHRLRLESDRCKRITVNESVTFAIYAKLRMKHTSY